MTGEEPEDLETETVRESAAAPQTSETILVTITKFGSGKVSTGHHVAGEGDIMSERGDVLEVSKTVAASLEAKGLAET